MKITIGVIQFMSESEWIEEMLLLCNRLIDSQEPWDISHISQEILDFCVKRKLELAENNVKKIYL